jgi:hypothetical protein
MSILLELEQKVHTTWEHVKNMPLQRFALRKQFYKKFGFGGILGYGYGNSEIAFLNWEINRGVLHPTKGSAWWRGVSETLALESGLASAIYEAGAPITDLPAPIKLWLQYFKEPSTHTWYRAHNASIVSGYKKYLPALQYENEAERIFVNRVLYLVLFAGACAEGIDGFGMSQLLLNPSFFSVNIALLSYPDQYPIISQQALGIFGIDKMLILPRLETLYEFSATLLQMPVIRDWQQHNLPTYGIEADVWKIF